MLAHNPFPSLNTSPLVRITSPRDTRSGPARTRDAEDPRSGGSWRTNRLAGSASRWSLPPEILRVPPRLLSLRTIGLDSRSTASSAKPYDLEDVPSLRMKPGQLALRWRPYTPAEQLSWKGLPPQVTVHEVHHAMSDRRHRLDRTIDVRPTLAAKRIINDCAQPVACLLAGIAPDADLPVDQVPTYAVTRRGPLPLRSRDDDSAQPRKFRIEFVVELRARSTLATSRTSPGHAAVNRCGERPAVVRYDPRQHGVPLVVTTPGSNHPEMVLSPFFQLGRNWPVSLLKATSPLVMPRWSARSSPIRQPAQRRQRNRISMTLTESSVRLIQRTVLQSWHRRSLLPLAKLPFSHHHKPMRLGARPPEHIAYFSNTVPLLRQRKIVIFQWLASILAHPRQWGPCTQRQLGTACADVIRIVCGVFSSSSVFSDLQIMKVSRLGLLTQIKMLRLVSFAFERVASLLPQP